MWIASFPRSGNHRIRQVIYNLLFDKQAKRGELNQLEELGYKKMHGMVAEGKAIYSIRNREDVVKSVMKFMTHVKGDRKLAEDYVDRSSMTYWTGHDIGNREENIKYYLNRPDTLVLNYEDFSPEQVKQIAEFCGLTGDYEKIYNWNIGENAKYIDIDSGMPAVITSF